MRSDNVVRSYPSAGGFGPVGSGELRPVDSAQPSTGNFITYDEMMSRLRVYNTFLEVEEEDEFAKLRRPRSHSHSGSSRTPSTCKSPSIDSRPPSSQYSSDDLSSSSPRDLTSSADPRSQSMMKTQVNDSAALAKKSSGDESPSSDDLPSVGSLYHYLGTCKPCHFAKRGSNCFAGEKCPYCHMPHETQPRAGKKSRERARRRQHCFLESINTQTGHDQQHRNQEAFSIQWDIGDSGASASGEQPVWYPEGTKISL
eukprot:gnl/MRDRNA2_/MRDRNA2_79861_c0_seq1.p1 gnl/MRDRNA2_/MRDRNA2_79861_c0~~gnl/MRDRNA2_/MRDRNA2_79861_c0_seq1.p1  ORF type:complete len:256 (+),score=23.02 gnl/MRDRNA2_/MRDRNA2_79861_c0_seq1:63-830(+)